MPSVSKKIDKDAFPTVQLIVLGICRFSEPIAFNSIMAYSSVMVVDLGKDKDEAAFYAGLLVSAYALAEAMTALGWGAISDVYGRKPVALIGLGGVALSSLMFGCAKSYWVALLARFIGGALNGNVAIMQTMVAEMVTNPAHEPRAYATQPFVWTLGGIIGSAMGGFLAKPAHYYPNHFSQDGLFGRYPYLLPNLVAAVSIVGAIIQGIIFLKETNPKFASSDSAIDDESIDERTPLHGPPRARQERLRYSISRGSQVRERSSSVIDAFREVRKRPSFLEEGLPMPTEQRFDLRRTSFGTMHSIRLHNEVQLPSQRIPIVPQTPPRQTFNYTVMMMIASLTIVAFHQMAYITTLPVFILDDSKTSGLDLEGGLGMEIPDVGIFLAVNGIIALFIQAVIFPIFVDAVGVWKSFTSMLILYPITYVFIPFVTAGPKWMEAPGIYLSLILQAFFGIISFPAALILLKNATPSPLVLGRVNGAAMSACCLARTISPPLLGVIYSIGGSAAAWWALMVVAIIGALQLIWVPNEHVEAVTIENGLMIVAGREDNDDAMSQY